MAVLRGCRFYFVEYEECPYVPDGESPFGKQLISYQIESADGKHEVPDEFFSFEIFGTKKQAEAWMEANNTDNLWKIVPVYDGDIEGVTYFAMFRTMKR